MSYSTFEIEWEICLESGAGGFGSRELACVTMDIGGLNITGLNGVNFWKGNNSVCSSLLIEIDGKKFMELFKSLRDLTSILR